MRIMKDSGIEWVKDIPSTWDVAYLSAVLSERKNKNIGMKENNLLSLSYGNVIRKDITTNDGLLPESFEGYNIIEKDDIVLRLTDLQNDHRSLRTGLCKERGIITSAYCTLKKNSSKYDSRFLQYYLHSFDICKGFYGMGAGVRQGLNYDGIRKIEILLPPLAEQIAIADCIEEKTKKVDALIANQEAQIEKLKAYKQSLITEVVTKGLNPNVPMKSSGVEAIGSIPQHWKIYRTKFVADAIFKGNGITKDEVVEDGDIQCIRYGEIYSKYDGSFEKTYSRTNESAITSPQYISSGDILFAGTGELVEEIGKNVVYTGKEPCLAGGDIIVLKHSQNPIFLNYALYCTSSQTQKSKGKAKLKVVHISASEIGNVIIALPPLDEQNAIAEYLDKKCEHISRLIEIKKKKIESLTQYKKSLIYEYVTGKKEVM